MESALYKISTWIMRMAFVNILWISFTIIGFVVLGFFPATVAMFTIVRHWIRGDSDIPIYSTFWNTYKQYFLRANILGIIFAIAGVVLFWDLLFFRDFGGPIGFVLFFLSIVLALFYLMTAFILIPVIVHYDIKTTEYIKYAFIISSSYPLHAIYIGLSIYVIFYVTTWVPVIFLFFSGSFLSLVIMRFAYTAFEKIEKKKESRAIIETAEQ
ncbi:YesL family protein [Salipaludibacillus sp. HK11]|uniref:YesL family protein n=1 Tax=Salipaludibacillus sp. HK11 TaxID=3394320 RepID=UPI0039FDC9F2